MHVVAFFFLLRGVTAIVLRGTANSIQPSTALKNNAIWDGVSMESTSGSTPASDSGGLNVAEVVAGHASAGGDAMLTGAGKIYKAIPEGDKRAQKELEFYQWMQNNEEHCLKKFLPTFSGEKAINNINYLVMEDITFGFKHANVIDLKMGTRIYARSADKKKQTKQIESYPKQTTFGFRITGCKVWQKNDQAYEKKDKKWGPSFDAEEKVKGGLEWFFNNGMTLVPTLVGQLKSLKTCMEGDKTWGFIGSSLLVAYDGGADSKEIRMRAIDFAYASTDEKDGKEEDVISGYLKGLDNLIKYLSSIPQPK
eukprot:GEMP01024982.1.p1 GENE.GEMP01024982.1~~GEMP01024982.1.p1  ORF type:complete len:309 (+),score=67.28 GEMP01024982.1:379-1305(+)